MVKLWFYNPIQGSTAVTFKQLASHCFGVLHVIPTLKIEPNEVGSVKPITNRLFNAGFGLTCIIKRSIRVQIQSSVLQYFSIKV